jgi:hypothetical protein
MENEREEMPGRRLNGWEDWFRFARRELGYSDREAREYANIRTVEDLNRAHRPDREAA